MASMISFIGIIETLYEFKLLCYKITTKNRYTGRFEYVVFDNIAIYNNCTYVVINVVFHPELLCVWQKEHNLFNMIYNNKPKDFYEKAHEINIGCDKASYLYRLMDKNNQRNMRTQIISGMTKLVNMLNLPEDISLLICHFMY